MEALDTPGERDSEKGRPLEAAVLLQRVKPATPVFLKLSSGLTERLLEASLASSPRLTVSGHAYSERNAVFSITKGTLFTDEDIQT